MMNHSQYEFRQAPGFATKSLCRTACLAISDPRRRVCHFVSEDQWGSLSEPQFVVQIPSILQTLGVYETIASVTAVQTLALLFWMPPLKMGRGADGRNAMADG